MLLDGLWRPCFVSWSGLNFAMVAGWMRRLASTKLTESEQSAHMTAPHSRQWCLRLSMNNYDYWAFIENINLKLILKYFWTEIFISVQITLKNPEVSWSFISTGTYLISSSYSIKIYKKNNFVRFLLSKCQPCEGQMLFKEICNIQRRGSLPCDIERLGTIWTQLDIIFRQPSHHRLFVGTSLHRIHRKWRHQPFQAKYQLVRVHGLHVSTLWTLRPEVVDVTDSWKDSN